MKLKKLILAGVLASMPLFAVPAMAGEYCREYQKTIRVGGQIESGYGTACLQPDGSWMIVESEGTVDPFDELRRQRDVVIVSDRRPVYYTYGPSFRPVNYYPRHYNRSGFFISYGDNDRWDRWNRWDRRDYRGHRWNGRDRRYDHHDRDNDRNRGRGRDRD